MEKDVRCFEIRTFDGKPILTVQVCEKQPIAASQQNGHSSNANSDPAITEAQKRYIFRILAEQGYEGGKAQQQLKDLLGVDKLEEASKVEASKLIDQLLDGIKEVNQP